MTQCRYCGKDNLRLVVENLEGNRRYFTMYESDGTEHDCHPTIEQQEYHRILKSLGRDCKHGVKDSRFCLDCNLENGWVTDKSKLTITSCVVDYRVSIQ